MEKITFGDNLPGYIYGPSDAKAGVVVVQEWWGITPEIQEQAKHIADKAGYKVLIPDLYKGKMGVDKEEAHHLMSNLDFPAAIGEIGAAVQHLRSLGAQKVGVVGFCMGGALTFAAGQHAGADAIAPYYGYNPQAVDLTKITCPVLFQSGTEDKFKGFSDPDTARLIEKTLKEAGKDSEVVIYEGADHGFLNGITEGSQKLKEHMGFVPTPPEVYTKSWDKLFAFFGKNLAV